MGSRRLGTKLFYKIGEVCRLAGIRPHVLRYWETEFPSLRPRKNRGGQRVYQPKDLDMVFRIKRMLHEEGYTIAGAIKKLGAKGPGQPVSEAGSQGGEQEILARPGQSASEEDTEGQQQLSSDSPAEAVTDTGDSIADTENANVGHDEKDIRTEPADINPEVIIKADALNKLKESIQDLLNYIK